MDKLKVINALKAHLGAEMEAAKSASLDAASYATSGEAKAESKWDTQGLEASYLAAGQAKHYKELQDAVNLLQGIQLGNPSPSVSIYSLVECHFGPRVDTYFLSPVGGGVELNIEGHSVTVITPESPLGSQLLNQRLGASVFLPNGMQGVIKACG